MTSLSHIFVVGGGGGGGSGTRYQIQGLVLFKQVLYSWPTPPALYHLL
jgi:hypothetical protein